MYYTYNICYFLKNYYRQYSIFNVVKTDICPPYPSPPPPPPPKETVQKC